MMGEKRQTKGRCDFRFTDSRTAAWHPSRDSYTHTYVIDTLLCHGGGAPGSAGWVAKRKIDCSAHSAVLEIFCAQCCLRREISKRRTASHIHLERATVRLSRTEYPICDDTSPAAGAMQ